MKKICASRLPIITCVALFTSSVWAQDLMLKIDPSKTNAPISKYIYGQFIEHLGRCIYGGLWAEMLEDRKFGYPIKDKFNPWGVSEDPNWRSGAFQYLKASPWRVMGPPGTVEMNASQSLTGTLSPRIHLAGDDSFAGIFQDGLAVEKNKIYVGRVILRGDDHEPAVNVQLILDDGAVLVQKTGKLGKDFKTFPIQFKATFTSANARFAIAGKGKGSFTIGAVSLMPSDNLDGWRSDTVALVKQLDSPIYRWPGGNFVSGYDWHDGLGDRDRRPPRANPAWTGMEPNDVGIHEFMRLMKLIDAEPYISVNTGLGTVQQAADEVEYFNGGAETPLGRLRAANGHPEPFRARFWAVGNEMYGSWQLGHMPIEKYIQKHNLVAQAMLKVDPNLILVGVGDIYTLTPLGAWSAAMLRDCGSNMDLISEHIYCKEETNLQSHVDQLVQRIRQVAEAHRQYNETITNAPDRKIGVVMDEWNYWYGPYVYGELGVQYHFKDALGVAKALHEYFRNSDIFFMANYAQTVNVIGAIKTSATAACMDTTALPLALYRHHFGSIPIAVPLHDGHLDISAAWTENKDAITFAVVNPGPSDQKLSIDWNGMRFKNAARQWVIHNSDPQSINEPGKPPAVAIVESEINFEGSSLTVPGMSIIVYRLEVQ